VTKNKHFLPFPEILHYNFRSDKCCGSYFGQQNTFDFYLGRNGYVFFFSVNFRCETGNYGERKNFGVGPMFIGSQVF